MGNNRQTTHGRVVQIVRSEPEWIFKEKYLSPKGQRLWDEGKCSKAQAYAKYGKIRYVRNPNSVPIKTIHHISV